MAAKKGFFFTVLALILLSFMMVSVQTWAQTQQMSESRAASRFRAEALRSAVEILDDKAINRFSNASLLYSLNFLSTKLTESPCSPYLQYDDGGGSYPDGTYRVAITLAELMQNGTSFGAGPSSAGPFACGLTDPYGNLWNGNLTFPAADKKYAISDYLSKTGAAARLLGFNLTWGPVRNLSINQSDIWLISASYDVDANLTDASGFSYAKTVHVVAQVDINGLADPFVTSMDRAHRPSASWLARPRKQVFHVPDYATYSDARAKILRNGTEGLGMFLGPIADAAHDHNQFSLSDPSYNLSKINSYIYATDAANWQKAIAESAYFGGIILIGNPVDSFVGMSTPAPGCQVITWKQSNCVYCRTWQQSYGSCTGVTLNPPTTDPATALLRPIPYIQVPSSPLSQISPNYRTGLKEALINNARNFTQVFGNPSSPSWGGSGIGGKFPTYWNESILVDMNGPRDMAICGYYVPSENGPSYLKRFTNPAVWGGTPYSYVGGKRLGIESMVVGKWAGGADDPKATGTASGWTINSATSSSEFFSRVDYQFYRPYITSQKCIGLFIKGMPGCKDGTVCAPSNTSAVTEAAGRFAFDSDPRDRYALGAYMNTSPGSGQVASGCN